MCFEKNYVFKEVGRECPLGRAAFNYGINTALGLLNS